MMMMKRGLLLGMLFILCCSSFIYGQDASLEQLKEKFKAGERSLVFLEDYWKVLKTSNEDASLKEEVLDCYLLALPFTERYSKENIEIIISQIQTIRAKIFIDVVNHWDSIALNEEQKLKLVEKVNQTSSLSCFNWIVQLDEHTRTDLPLLKDLEQSLLVSSIPVSKSRVHFIQLWNCFAVKQVDDCVSKFCLLLNGEKFDLREMFDFGILSTIGDYLLENCTLSQCTEIITALDNCLKGGTLTDMGVKPLQDLKDSFEGKKMMIEMGEE